MFTYLKSFSMLSMTCLSLSLSLYVLGQIGFANPCLSHCMRSHHFRNGGAKNQWLPGRSICQGLKFHRYDHLLQGLNRACY